MNANLLNVNDETLKINLLYFLSLITKKIRARDSKQASSSWILLISPNWKNKSVLSACFLFYSPFSHHEKRQLRDASFTQHAYQSKLRYDVFHSLLGMTDTLNLKITTQAGPKHHCYEEGWLLTWHSEDELAVR